MFEKLIFDSYCSGKMMSLSEVVQSMRRRIPWEVGKSLIKEIGLPTGRGWDNTVQKILDDNNSSFKEKDLREALEEHILCGEKSVRFYQIEGENLEILRRFAQNYKNERDEFSEIFPRLASEENLDTLRTRGMKIVAIRNYTDASAIIFSSVRSVQYRERLLADDFPDEMSEAIKKFDEVVGVRLRHWQALDVVWIPNAGTRISVRVDFPPGTSHEISELAHRQIGDEISQALGRGIFTSPIDIFGLINKIYQDPNEGRVVELAFSTNTASSKHEKMRLRHLDLRRENYHVAGKNGLNAPIDPFRLAVEWDIYSNQNILARPEILFLGSSRSFTLSDVIIRGCRGFSDYAKVQARLIHHMEVV